MAVKFEKYTTKYGDRWDSIATDAYGDASRVPEIAKANPGVPLDAVLPPGIDIYIPVSEEIEQDKTNLPPWKR